jgi:WD40 repeat protein
MMALGRPDGLIKLWEVGSGREPQDFAQPGGDIRAVVFSPDGRTLATTGVNGSVKLWDVAARKELHTFGGNSGDARAMVFSPDGRTLATTNNHEHVIKLWDPATGKELRTLQGHDAGVTSVAFSPDGRALASGSFGRPGPIKLWDVATGKELHSFQGPGYEIESVSFHPDGKTLASTHAYSHTVYLRDVATGQKLRQVSGGSPAFSPDGKTLATGGGGTIRFWDPHTAKEKDSLRIGPSGGSIHQIVYTPDGRHLATVNGNGTVYVLRLAPPLPGQARK